MARLGVLILLFTIGFNMTGKRTLLLICVQSNVEKKQPVLYQNPLYIIMGEFMFYCVRITSAHQNSRAGKICPFILAGHSRFEFKHWFALA